MAAPGDEGDRNPPEPPSRGPGQGGHDRAPDRGRASGGGGGGGGRSGPVPTPPRRGGGINLRRLGGNDFELVHPRCVSEMELDYEEGMEIWKAGDPEGARDALRYALQGCGDNLWVHVALGRIALEDFRDPSLARGHFGYAVELVQKTVPSDFPGRLSPDKRSNRPYFEAIDGLATCYEALGKPIESEPLRLLAARLSGRGKPGGPRRPGGPGHTGQGEGNRGPRD